MALTLHVLASVAWAAAVPLPAEGTITDVVWAPDGGALAARVTRPGAENVVVQALHGAFPAGAPVHLRLPGTPDGAPVHLGRPSWADARTLVTAGSTNAGPTRLYVGQVGSPILTELVAKAAYKGELSAPSVHPKTQRVAFIGTHEGRADLHLVNLKKNNLRQLTTTPEPEDVPAWAPDNKRLAFERAQATDRDLFVLDLPSMQTTLLAGGPGDQVRPAWASNQRAVYYTSAPTTADWSLATVTPGATPTTLVQAVRLPAAGPPPLTPDGRHVATTSTEPTERSIVSFHALDGDAAPRSFDTGLVDVSEVALVRSADRILMACTGFTDPGAPRRTLHVFDVTAALSAAPQP